MNKVYQLDVYPDFKCHSAQLQEFQRRLCSADDSNSPKDKPQKLSRFSHGQEHPLQVKAEMPPVLQKRLSSLKT